MGKGPTCNAATKIFLICVISALIFHTDCSHTERMSCEPQFCQHGICYRTTKSITVVDETNSYAMQCPYGFEKHKLFCFRLDYGEQSWLYANEHLRETDILATLFDKEYVNIAAEYLRSKLSDNHAPVWVSLLFDDVNVLPDVHQPCTALEPTNYTRWQMRDCRSQLYSLRTYAVSNPIPSYEFMCRCHTGYTGKSCDIIDSMNSTQELENPDMLQCPSNTLIHVEFALNGYKAENTTGMDTFSTSTLAILRSQCQGKTNCTIQRHHGSSYFHNKPQFTTLAVRHSCVNARDLNCPSNSFRIQDEKSVNCILPMHRYVAYRMVHYYCLQNGGHLASFNGGIHNANFSAIARMFKHLTTFWTSDELHDNRNDDQWAMAITSHLYNLPYESVPIDKLMLLPGLCVIPPLHPANTMADTTESNMVETTDSTMEDTTMNSTHHNATSLTTTSVHNQTANTSNIITLNIIAIFGYTICLASRVISFAMN